jgi:hypothetical protein
MKPLASNKFKAAEFVRNVFAITPPPGVTIEDMLKREYWTNVAQSLAPMTRIEVLPRDGKFFAELIVTASGKNWANVCLRDFVELDNFKAPADNAIYTVKHLGSDSGWAVIRNSDHEVMGDGFDTSDEATSWMENFSE